MGSPVQTQPTADMMMLNISSLLASLAIIATASPVEVENTETKASSPLINCGCQCSSLTFRDANGVVQGNCLTVDSTGAQWCYVDSAFSSCQDLVPSKRFPNNPWSYEACATPAQGSPLCPVIAAPVIPVVPVAPAVVPHEPVHVHPTYPVEPVHVHVPAPVHPPVHPTYPVPEPHPHPVAPSSAGPVEAVGPLGPGTIQEIFGANGGYDPESIGEPRQGDASSKSKFLRI